VTQPPDLRHALLIGQGRSGTNFLLGLLDQSTATHCRNEPDQLDGSALARLSPFRFFVDDPAQLAGLYEPAVRRAAACVGPRDHLAEVEKDWLRRGVRRPGYFYLRQRYRLVERVLRRRKPMDGREIEFPRWMADRARLERSLHVFKLNAAVGIGSWVLVQRPRTRVLQIVRHPGGFAKSWWTRWVRGEGGMDRGRGTADALRDEERLRALARRDDAWAKRLGDVDRIGRAEGELWWWRYVNEALLEAGRGKPGHHLVLYEDLARDPIGVSRAAYAFLGLTFDAGLERRVAAMAEGAEEIARAWKDELEPEMATLVEKVLDGSPMAAWWPDEEVARAA